MTKLPSYECPFQVGDTVITQQPPVDEEERPPYWDWEMEEFVGLEATVTPTGRCPSGTHTVGPEPQAPPKL